MSTKFFSSLIFLTALLVFDGWGQTNPTAQSLPFSVNFGTSTFTSMPAGMAAWNGLSGASVSTQATAETTAPTGNATVTAASVAQAGGGVFGYATSSNGRAYVQTSSNATNGVNQVAFAINTGSATSINIQYKIEVISIFARTVGSVLQYRSGTSGSWTTITGSGFAYNTSSSNGGDADGAGDIDSYLFTLSGLSTNTVYQFRWAHWRGTETGSSSGLAYDDLTIVAEPTTSASALNFTSVTTSGMTINWTNGNGAGRAVFVKEASGAITDPVDGTTYTASANWTSKGTQLGASGYYCVYDGTGSTVTLSNLTASTTYFVYVYEYNGSGASINYRTTSPANSNQTTASAGPDPNVAFTGTDPGNAQFVVGTTKNIIYRAQVSVTGSDVQMTDAGFSTSGNYAASDIQGGGFKLYYSVDATLDIADVEIGNISSLSNGVDGDLLLFTGFTRDFAVGTAYLFLTVDVDAAATALRTINTDLPTAADFSFTATVTNTGSNFAVGSVHTFYKSPPALTADNTLNNVDNDIDITFTDNASWQGAISAVKIGGTALTVTTDYVVSAGMIKLKPLGGNSLLTTAGSKSVTVEATGYITASVTQQINAGAPTSNSTASISAALSLNTLRTVTVTAKDQYNNVVPGYTFVYDATITDADASTDESYLIDGTARTTTVTDINLTTVTDATGITTFGITLPAVIDGNDGISVQVQLTNGTSNVGSAFSYSKQPITMMISHLSATYSGASDEFIVLFNNSNSDFELNGYELQYFSAAGGTGLNIPINTSTIIPSKKHYLLATSASVVVGSVSVSRDKSFTGGMGTSGQMVLRQSSNTSNILYAVAWGTITSYVAGMTNSATWSGAGMISLSPSGTTYIRSDYNTSNAQYSHTLAANIAYIPNSSDAPLPVELTSFTAKASGTTVTLNWETKTEVDNNGFEIERNANGNWSKIGFVEGHGTANSPKYYSFSDANPLGNKIQYRLKQIDNDGSFEYSPVVEVELAPVNYTLYQNYPNPFNPSTVIRYAMPVAGMVTIDVFNALGEKVSTLLNGQVEAGFNQVSFDATNLPSGLYFYRIQSGDFTSIKKMLLMK